LNLQFSVCGFPRAALYLFIILEWSTNFLSVHTTSFLDFVGFYFIVVGIGGLSHGWVINWERRPFCSPLCFSLNFVSDFQVWICRGGYVQI
jgi:hypothetical protein